MLFEGGYTFSNFLVRASSAGARRASTCVGFSAADEIEKLERLKKAGSITDAEFARLRTRLVQ
jgi:hypothetical protein